MCIKIENMFLWAELTYGSSCNCYPQNFIYTSVSFCVPLPKPIHLHPLFSELKDGGFNIQKRGHIEVKGKGQMTTYFLLGNLLVSEDSIMGREDGGKCLYRKDLHGQSKKGKEYSKLGNYKIIRM